MCLTCVEEEEEKKQREGNGHFHGSSWQVQFHMARMTATGFPALFGVSEAA
jgi:hypothetical protein